MTDPQIIGWLLGGVLEKILDQSVPTSTWKSGESLSPNPAPELEQAYEKAGETLAADPRNIAALFQRAVVCRTKGWYPQALAHFREVLRLEPKNARAWLLSSEVLDNLGYHHKAQELRQVALELDPALK